MAATVTQVWRYPAKSMQGEALAAAELDDRGLVGDRWWAVRDEVRGGIRGAKYIGTLMALVARYRSEPSAGQPPPAIDIGLPGGTVVGSDDPAVHERLSAALDHPVTLWPLQPPSDLDHDRRGAPDSDDLLAELRSIFARDDDEPLPDFSVFPPEIFESPPGTYVDAYPLLVLTEQSLASLATLAPGSRVDVRRFRPNLVVDADGLPGAGTRWPEQTWVGRTLRVGTVELDVVAGCPRCVMITRGFAELPDDRGLMRTVVREADQLLGVYATVRTAGTVTVGDRVEVTSRPPA